jgi:cytochrome c-type protein NapC
MAERSSRLGKIWSALRTPSGRWSVLTLAGLGFVLGILFWGGFNTAMEATNTLGFCTGCHEMRSTVFVEYQETIHYKNRSGVRATCSDCHVPREWFPKVMRKIQASNELYGKLMGTIDTPAKFEAKRAELASHVWKRMKETDSLECRNCHTAAAMSPDKQTEKAQTRHAKGQREGLTCIDCHYAIAHKEPEGPGPQELFSKKP